MSINKVSFLHNVISPYKTVIFNELNKTLPSMEVIYMAPTQKIRDWTIGYKEIKFPYSVMFEKALDDINSYKLAIKTWSTLNKVNPDILIICEYINISYWVALLWGKIHGAKLVFWCDSTYGDRKRYLIKELIKKIFVKRFDAGLAPGQKSFEYLHYLGLTKDKIYFSGYPIDNDFYNKEYKKQINKRNQLQSSFSFQKNNFLFVGRFSPEKNLFYLLKSYKEVLTQNYKDWGLVLVGDGPLRPEIEAFIEKNNLQGMVHLPGFIQKDQICQYYACSDALILPSLSETWGLVVNEAMACGLPVVVSKRCGCYPELVKGNGILFNPSNMDELKQVLIDIICQKYDFVKMGKKSFEIIQEFAPSKSAAVIKKAILTTLQ